jgi:hypothetical protein
MNKFAIVILCITALSACSEIEPSASGKKNFDTIVFTENEIAELLALNLSASKTIVLNGNTETVSEISVNEEFLRQEFAPLVDANINRASMIGRYQIDTLSSEPDNKHIRFTTDNEKLKTRLLEYRENELLKVMVANRNFMNSYQKTFEYIPKTSVSVNGWQKSLMEDTLFYSVQIEFSR